MMHSKCGCLLTVTALPSLHREAHEDYGYAIERGSLP